MSNPKITPRAKSKERGQTLVLVALTLVTLLAMAALAIDVVTLYVAKSEAQRAADAAALAGAKAFVDSGVTTDPTNSSLQTLAQSMATAIINAMIGQNKVSGTPPQLASPPSFNFTQDGNPRITVTLQRTDLPIFFARIWGGTLANVSATATAEAYNASNSQILTGNLVPIAPKCVKPFLIPNRDPDGLPFVDTTTGKVMRSNFVGEVITGGLKLGCNSSPNNACVLTANPPDPGTYVPALVTANAANLCPSCSGGASNYEQSIGCCDATPYSCGGPTSIATVDFGINPGPPSGYTHNGVQCLIHKPVQDTLVTSFPTGPMQITAGSGPQYGNLVTTSSSIVTIPIFDDSVPIDTTPGSPTRGQVNVVGFLQAFISDANGSGTIDATILNVVGCGNSPSGTAISGGGVTPIPVRLIHN
jgi:hypothetical protein